MNTPANIVTGQPRPCPDHPDCLLQRCRRLWCHNTVHVKLISRGQPRRYCSTRCRVAEHRRLHQ
jgi:hypothetical protein